MKISLKEYFLSLSSLLDFLEVELHSKPTNHCKRVSLFALAVGNRLGLSEFDLVTLGALSLLHDLGASHAKIIQILEKQQNPNVEVFPDHCRAGANLIDRMPFLAAHSGAILYHHERYDGRGFYGLKEEIPLFSQIIALSDRIDLGMTNIGLSKEKMMETLKKESGKSFSPDLAEIGQSLLSEDSMEESYLDVNITEALSNRFPDFTLDLSYEELTSMTGAFSTIVDAKSPFTKNHSSDLASKTAIMCSYFGMDKIRTHRMIIAANLHDIGKLSVPNRILDKNGKLTKDEFAVIRQHTFYTRQALSQISGWEDITDWASDHHEKLNGRGYPIGKDGRELPFESRLMACLDIYQALSESRPYKEGFSTEKSFSIMDECVGSDEIDGDITADLKKVFRQL
nr:HD domain-containing phosphohydrolase [uncultured Sphaerochaeta sp.]